MRKLIIISIFLLHSIWGFTQKVIDEKEFINLVDYVSCKYANEYMKNLKKNSNDSIAYYKILKPLLDISTLNDHLTSNELFKLMSDNSWGETASKLVKARQTGKNFSEIKSKSNDAIIEYIVKIEGKFQTTIGDVFINKIKQELLAEYTEEKPTVQNHVQENTNTSPSPTTNVQKGNNEQNLLMSEKERDIQKLWVSVVITLLLAAITVFLFQRMRMRNSVKRKKKPSNKISKDELQDLKEKFQDLKENIIKEIKQEIDNSKLVASNAEQSLETNYSQSPSQNPNSNTVEKPEIIKKIKTEQYFKTKSRKAFYQECETANEASFKVLNIRTNNAEFEYCGGVVAPDFLTDVCEFLNNPWKLTGIKNIITKTAGKVSKNYDGNWEVTMPAKIKFE